MVTAAGMSGFSGVTGKTCLGAAIPSVFLDARAQRLGCWSRGDGSTGRDPARPFVGFRQSLSRAAVATGAMFDPIRAEAIGAHGRREFPSIDPSGSAETPNGDR